MKFSLPQESFAVYGASRQLGDAKAAVQKLKYASARDSSALSEERALSYFARKSSP